MRLGYTEEAGAFNGWIEERCRHLNADGSLQIMYGIDGRQTLTEETLPHFSGFRDSRPVRIGNAAYSQLQLDIHGELMDSVYHLRPLGAADQPSALAGSHAPGGLGDAKLAAPR